MLYYLLAQKRHIQGLVIAMGGIIALIEQATTYKDPIHSISQGTENKLRVYPAGTHNADKSYVCCVL